jgi:sporulation protein YlmC with PRC-barrel domain
MNPINLFASSELESREVIDSIGQEYGKIKDLIIDPQHHKVLMVVITSRDFKNNFFVIPWPAIRINPNTHTCILEINRETIEHAPEISYEDLLEGDKETLVKIFSYYGFENFMQQEDKNKDSIKSTEPVKDKHNTFMGSEASTKSVPKDESKLSNEMDFDKLSGNKNK